MDQEQIPVRLDIETLDVANELQRIIRSMNQFRILNHDDQEPAELLILEIQEQADKAFDVIRSLLGTGMVGEVFVTSSSSAPDFLLNAMRSGTREFFLQPLQEADVAQALERFMKRREQLKSDRRSLKNGKIIDVIASKGGVGNTTLAVNLAIDLSGLERQLSVALVDMNLLFGEVPLFLDFDPTYHWGEIARNISRLDSTFLMSVLHKHHSGVYVLPSPSQLSGNFEGTPEIMERLLRLMRTVFDYVVIDSGHVTDEVSMKILEMADTVLLTATLSLPCLTNVSRFLKLFCDLGYPLEDQVKIIVNRFVKNADIGIKDAEKSIGKEVFWVIPNDFSLTMSAINQGKPLSEFSSRSEVARSIRALAETFLARGDQHKKSASLLGRLFGKRN